MFIKAVYVDSIMNKLTTYFRGVIKVFSDGHHMMKSIALVEVSEISFKYFICKYAFNLI